MSTENVFKAEAGCSAEAKNTGGPALQHCVVQQVRYTKRHWGRMDNRIPVIHLLSELHFTSDKANEKTWTFLFNSIPSNLFGQLTNQS